MIGTGSRRRGQLALTLLLALACGSSVASRPTTTLPVAAGELDRAVPLTRCPEDVAVPLARRTTTVLPCLTAPGGLVRIAPGSGRAEVINVWASWCEPCRAELPAVEAFAKAAGPAVEVIGVDTADERSAAQSTISDFTLTYPMVSDPGQHILHSIGAQGLPATLFVAPGGDIRYVYNSGTALDTAHLDALAATYLGVTVRR